MPAKFPAVCLFAALVVCLPSRPVVAASDLPVPTQGDYVMNDFHFASGHRPCPS